jgi:hypothetical protein
MRKRLLFPKSHAYNERASLKSAIDNFYHTDQRRENRQKHNLDQSM